MTEKELDSRLRGNDGKWWDDVESDPIHLEAAEWLARLQDSEVSLEDTLAWQAWMKESAKHAAAFSRLEEVSGVVRRVRPLRTLSARELARDRYDGSVSLSALEERERKAFSGVRSRALAASVVLLVVIGAGVLGSRFRGNDVGTVLTTVVGENRTVPLADGSRVTLGGNTRIDVALSAEVRSIELARGEAFFAVAKDPRRPFKVHAGDATVTVVGTQFNVRRVSDRAVVAVTEGRVVVEPATRLVPIALLREFKPKLRPVHVDAGQQTTAGSAGIEDASRVEDPSSTTSWQTGRLAFRLQPLRDVLEDVNRYAQKPIAIDDADIGALVITGTVTGGNVGGWIESLERAFSLEAVEEDGRIVLRKSRPPDR
jgi:transmembrane sensor